MSLLVQRLDQHELRTLLSSALRCREQLPALRTAVIADHIRTLVWASHCRARETDAQPVHTSRIFSALHRNVRFLFSEESGSGHAIIPQHSEFEFVRDQLERCGDIFHVGNGYWIPGPVRLVRATGSPTLIVLGGLPTSVLQRVLNTQCRSIGPARYVSGALSSGGAYPEETTMDWLGTTESLAAWTGATLSWASTQLRPQAQIEDDTLEIYAPDVHQAHGRLGFWIAPKEFREPTPTLRLFRPKTVAKFVFDRPDYLGTFMLGPTEARLARSVPIPRDTAYRLRLGFDQKYATARSMHLRRQGDSFHFDLKFALPAPESRVLGLTWRDAPDDAGRFIDESALPALKDVAASLGIRVLQN